jgi:hypothetical protein
MQAENPPTIFRTPGDNIEWTYLQTFPDYKQMQEFRHKIQCQSKGKESHQRFRFPCNVRYNRNCQFKLLALKTTSEGYHVYKLGEHNHPIMPKSK